MSVKFKVKMTPQTMYSFMLHHNYTHLPGILSVIFSVVVFLVGLGQVAEEKYASVVLLFILAAFVIVYPLIMLKIRARRQVESAPVFQKSLEYELTESGVKVIQGDKEKENLWSDFQSAISTNQALVLYMDKRSAIIFPRAQIGEQWAAAVELISTHMPPDKVSIRQVN